MKNLFLSLLVAFSFNTFASEIGESKAVECEFANQSKRDQKEVEKLEVVKPIKEKQEVRSM